MFHLKYWITQFFALFVYLPLARTARMLDRLGMEVSHLPLSMYRNRSFYTMRTDALDRFGTRLERRFTRKEIERMMERAGLAGIEFSSSEPFWCAVGYRQAWRASTE